MADTVAGTVADTKPDTKPGTVAGTMAGTKPVLDLPHFEALTRDARYACAGAAAPVSHCYMLPEEAARLCAQGTLRYRLCANGLLLFHTRGRCVLAMVIADVASPLDAGALCGFDKPLRVDIPSQRGRYAPGAEALAPWLRQAGFAKRATARRISFRPAPAKQREGAGEGDGAVDGAEAGDTRAATRSRQAPALTLLWAGAEWAGAIMSLWEGTFDCIANDVPTRDGLETLLAQGHILCALAADGSLAGVLQAEFTASTGWLWHLAIQPSLRGQGIGRQLMDAFHAKGQAGGSRVFYAWVSDLDAGAWDFYQKLGYLPDGRESDSYIRI